MLKAKPKNTHKLTHKPMIVITLLFLMLLTVVFVFKKDKNTSTLNSKISNQVDLAIAQYSDKHITSNAIIKDQKFEHISFITREDRPKLFVTRQFATVFRALKLFFSSKGEDKIEEHGTWLWTPILQMSDEYMVATLNGVQKNGVNVVYLSLDSYLDIYTTPDQSEKQTKKKEFSNILE